MNVTGTFHNDATLRHITEAVMISKVPENDLINSKKKKWNYVHIPGTCFYRAKNRYSQILATDTAPCNNCKVFTILSHVLLFRYVMIFFVFILVT